MNNDAFVKNVASRLIEQIRKGTAPWQKPWRLGTSFLPFNPKAATDGTTERACYFSRAFSIQLIRAANSPVTSIWDGGLLLQSRE